MLGAATASALSTRPCLSSNCHSGKDFRSSDGRRVGVAAFAASVAGDDHVDAAADQLGGHDRQSLVVSVRPAIVDDDAAALGVVTGLNVELAPKKLELLHELIPSASTLALLVNPTNAVAT